MRSPLLEAVARIKAAFTASGMSYEELSKACGGRPAASTIHAILSGDAPVNEPRWSTLEVIAEGLGIDDLGESDNGAPLPVIIGDVSLPVLANGVERMASQTCAGETLAAYRAAPTLKGLGLIPVADDWMLPHVRSGGYVVCLIELHPSKASPHPSYGAPLAAVIIRSPKTGKRIALVGIWREDAETGRVTLHPTNAVLRDADGFAPFVILDTAEIDDAYTIVGVLDSQEKKGKKGRK